MYDRHEPEDAYHLNRFLSEPLNPNTTGEVNPRDKIAQARRGERVASHELFMTFLTGKQLYIGASEPYQFVEAPDCENPGLWRSACPCPEHQGGEGTHILNTSEVTLLLECGPDRVWVFISIPARYRSKYAWLPSVAMGTIANEELCGILVAGTELGRCNGAIQHRNSKST